MLAVETEQSCSKQEPQQRIIQLAVETEPALHLLYNDSILSLKSSLLNNSESSWLLDIPSLICHVMAISSVHFTFGTLFHLSLERPKRPLSLNTAPPPPKPLAIRRRTDQSRCGRKAHSSKPESNASRTGHSRLKMKFKKEVHTQRSSSEPTTPPTPVPLAVTSAFYPGWRSRRHSITAHNAPSRMTIPPGDRRLSRRFSIGLDMGDEHKRTHFPATIMYAEIVSHLESSLEPGRHFYRLQRFNECFCGSSMVDCLLAYCLKNLNSRMKREKATEMCRRLLSHGVIENVSHTKQQEAEGIVFKGSRLYRFTGNHFWEENMTSDLDGATTSASMPSLIQPGGTRRQRASSIKKMYTTFSQSKTGFVRKCKSRFSLRGANTI